MPTKRERRLQAARAAVMATYDPDLALLRCNIADADAAGDIELVAELRTYVPLPRTRTNKGAMGRVRGGHKPATEPLPAARSMAESLKQGLKMAHSLSEADSLTITTKIHTAAEAAAAHEAAPESPTIRAFDDKIAEDEGPDPVAETDIEDVGGAVYVHKSAERKARAADKPLALRDFVIWPLLFLAMAAFHTALTYHALDADAAAFASIAPEPPRMCSSWDVYPGDTEGMGEYYVPRICEVMRYKDLFIDDDE